MSFFHPKMPRKRLDFASIKTQNAWRNMTSKIGTWPEIMEYAHSCALSNKRVEWNRSPVLGKKHYYARKNTGASEKDLIDWINSFIFRGKTFELSLFWRKNMLSCGRIQHPISSQGHCRDPRRSIKGQPWRTPSVRTQPSSKYVNLWSSRSVKCQVSSVVSRKC